MLQVLKPTILKVILTIILLAVSFFVLIHVIGCAFGPSIKFSCSAIEPIFYFLLSPAYALISFEWLKDNMAVFILITVIHTYFISVFIASIFEIKRGHLTIKKVLPIFVIWIAALVAFIILAPGI